MIMFVGGFSCLKEKDIRDKREFFKGENFSYLVILIGI